MFEADPAAAARRWADAGAELLHVVDLDGAREGRPVNLDAVQRIRAAIDIPMELGGGMRDEETVARVIDTGIDRVILGTRALENPEWALSMVRRHPGCIVAGIDALDGKVRTKGWLEATDVDAADLAGQLDDPELAGVIVTDISRDGMFAGPNVAFTRSVQDAVSVPVFASGGVSNLDHIREVAAAGLAGVIVGKALYDGRIDLAEAIEVAHKTSRSERPGRS